MESLTIKEREEYLRQISTKIEKGDDQVAKYIEILEEYCNTHSCFAMAGVQLGIPKRIVYIKHTDPESIKTEDVGFAMINPIILNRKGKTEYWEACMSGLDNVALVERPYTIVVRYETPEGEEKEVTFDGFPSTVISHELDHLDGIFHMDRAKKLLVMTREERVAFRKENKYNIISKDCEFTYPPLKKVSNPN